MISVTLRFDPKDSMGIEGSEVAKFLMEMIKKNPSFVVDVARQIELSGPFGRITEER